MNFSFDWSQYSVGIVSSFSLFIPPLIINQIPLINIHPSHLPEWRGPAPIQYSLLSGQQSTGVSIIDLHPKTIDAGSILIQEPFEIQNRDRIYYRELEDSLADLGGLLAARVLNDFDHFWRNKTDQEPQNCFHSHKISKTDGVISFKTDSFQTISRKVRALSHQIPIKSLDLFENKQVFLEDIFLLERKTEIRPLEVYYDKALGAVLFPLADGIVGVKTFKIEGKSQIFTAGSFYSNYLKNTQNKFT